MRRDSPRPQPIPALIRGAVAQQQLRAGKAQAGIEAALPPIHEDDASAAADGIPINGVYRTGSNFVVRTV